MSDSLKIAFVVATKDRPTDLRKMLHSLSEQSIHPEQIVIVDASVNSVESIAKEFYQLDIEHILHPRPSASAQRNRGIKSVDDDIDIVGFLDDDIVLEEGAMAAMLRFWKGASEDLGGCAFNLRNPPSRIELPLKNSRLAELLGIYSKKKGVVMPSGWQTMTGTVSETIYVQWLPSGASMWRRNIFEKFRFDEYFDGYSYLEDLDFSLSVSKKYRLAVLAEAGFYHFPSSSGRIGPYKFGKIEVSNRLHFVRKHNLSISRFYIGLLLRLSLTVGSALTGEGVSSLWRAAGNCVGLSQSLHFPPLAVPVDSTK